MGSKAKTRAAKNGTRRESATVVLTGDRELVREYAELCLSRGFRVVCLAREGNLKGLFAKDSAVIVSSSIPRDASVALELTNLDLGAKRQNLRRLDEALDPDRLILTTSVVVSATEQTSWIDNRYRLIGFSALPSFSERRSVEVAPTVSSPVESMEIARRFFSTLGMDLDIVQDRVGMVFPRLLCHIINEAAFAIQEGCASPADVDKAATLGAGFPRGPIEWADRIGLAQVVAVLKALAEDLREERYRPCPLLQQLALSGQWWKRTPSQPETA